MLESVFMMGALGLIIGISLALASKVFYVYVDPLVEAIDGLLPGANCGGCGYPGCGANAEAIATGKSSPSSCVAGSADLAVAIASVMGVSIEAREPDIARPGCTYGVKDAALKYTYAGLGSCQAAAMLYGGMKHCHIGCLGLGSCARACPFDAIVMGEDGLPQVDEVKCTGCGTCERVCPKNIITLSSVTRRILKEYTTEDCTTPCQRACPAGINISEYIRQISLGDYHKSVQVIKERNPFPTVIGRICPRPCENECRRNLVDEPVAINYLKRFAADYERQQNDRIQPYKAPDTGRKIAVVGGGVEGLSAAFFAARLGHSPTVYEATSRLGGLLRTAIARNRLPGDILDWDIDGILEMGVEARFNQTMGVDFTVSSLLAGGAEAILLASGGWDSRVERLKDAPIEEAIPGTLLLIDLIRSGMENRHHLHMAKDVVLAESGPMTVDAVNICRKLGADGITVVSRRSMAQSTIDAQTINKLQADGVRLRFDTIITGISGTDDALTRIETRNLATQESEEISAGTLILDSGRLPELIFTPIKAETEAEGQTQAESAAGPVQWRAVSPYKNPAIGLKEGFLSEADAVTDFSAAIRAIAAGRRAAASAHQIMYGIEPELSEKVVTSETVVQNVSHIEQISASARQIMPLCNVSDISAQCPEIELGFDREKAKKEADRCLQCGLVCYSEHSISEKMAS